MRRLRALLLVTICLAMPAFGHHGELQRASRELDGWAVASFNLIDQQGRPLTQERLRGRWTFMLFGDTTGCAECCNAALSALAGLSKRIERAELMQTTQVVFVSLDPQRDTPARLREYLTAFDPRFVGGTGTPSMLHRLADEMGVKTALSPTAAIEQPDGCGSLLLVGPDATIRAEYLPPFDVPRLTSAYIRMRQGR